MPNETPNGDMENALPVFVCWSGEAAKQIASSLVEWVHFVFGRECVDVFFSEHMEGGAQWATKLRGALQRADLGIIVLTHGNTTNPWILFEAGALSKVVADTQVVPLLFGPSPKDLRDNPLAHFQEINGLQHDAARRLADVIRPRMRVASPHPDDISRRAELGWKDRVAPTLQPTLQQHIATTTDSLSPSSQSDKALLDLSAKVEQTNQWMAQLLELPTRLKAWEPHLGELRAINSILASIRERVERIERSQQKDASAREGAVDAPAPAESDIRGLRSERARAQYTASELARLESRVLGSFWHANQSVSGTDVLKWVERHWPAATRGAATELLVPYENDEKGRSNLFQALAWKVEVG